MLKKEIFVLNCESDIKGASLSRCVHDERERERERESARAKGTKLNKE